MRLFLPILLVCTVLLGLPGAMVTAQNDCSILMNAFEFPEDLSLTLGQCLWEAADAETAMQTAAQTLQLYFTKGGDDASLTQLLTQVPLDEFSFISFGGDVNSPIPPLVRSVDLNGDGLEDKVVAISFILDWSSSLLEKLPPGMLITLLKTTDGGYNPIYQRWDWGDPTMMGGGEIIDAGRLSSAGAAYLVTNSSSCGAHTCWGTMIFFNWAGTSFVPASEFPEPNDTAIAQYGDENGPWGMPYPTFSVQSDGDASLMVEMISGAIGSVGAGPTPPSKVVWRYDPAQQVWFWHGEEMPSPYLIHALVRGDTAMLNGNYKDALVYYKQAIFDDSLDPYLLTDPELATAYSYYRMILLTLLQENLDSARKLTKETGQRFAEGSWSLFYDISVALLNGYADGGIGAGCAAVVSRLQEAPALPFELMDWGYANDMSTVSDPQAFCPFTG